jgi:hypothetical protein
MIRVYLDEETHAPVFRLLSRSKHAAKTTLPHAVPAI